MVVEKNIITRVLDAIRGKEDQQPEKRAFFSGSGTYRSFAVSFTGEKNLGEIGPAKDYLPEYNMLRIRSWQSYIESEITKTVLDKFTLWMISKGLKLQANPNNVVLNSEGITVDKEKFNTIAEARFGIWAKSRNSCYSNENNLHSIAKEAYKNSKIGGDVLVILRYVKGSVKVQLIDGAHVQSPAHGSDYFPNKLENGNEIRNGIEIGKNGEHVAYHIRQKDLSFTRVEAKSMATGLTMAFMVYGNRFRLDNYRGIPLIATCLETLKKLERYKEATVGSAEERQKIVLQVVHNRDSTGENPMVRQLAKAMNADAEDDVPTDINGTELANTVAATTNKSAFNMPIGSELKSLESKNELMFKEFYSTNADIICAAVGIPPNVAFSIYNDSFSASRAATKDWEHTIMVNREDFSFQFYQPIYNLWLYTEILKNKIDAPGYLKADQEGNYMAVEAYQAARFTGSMFPHIDPLKEVNAERAKLGELAANIPLTTVEQATEVLNGGDSDSNIDQFANEVSKARQLKLVTEHTELQPVNEQDAP